LTSPTHCKPFRPPDTLSKFPYCPIVRKLLHQGDIENRFSTPVSFVKNGPAHLNLAPDEIIKIMEQQMKGNELSEGFPIHGAEIGAFFKQYFSIQRSAHGEAIGSLFEIPARTHYNVMCGSAK